MSGNKIFEKEGDDLKQLYNFGLDTHEKLLKSLKFPAEDVYGKVLEKEGISLEQITSRKTFQPK